MAEAFIMGGGGGATIQHITATNATSNTFTLTNPKRSKCLVFGRIYYSSAYYNDWDGILSSGITRDHALYGAKYSVYHESTSYPGAGVGGSTSVTKIFESENAITITRSANGVTITLNPDYPFNYRSTTTNSASNTIDIYVVDYD